MGLQNRLESGLDKGWSEKFFFSQLIEKLKQHDCSPLAIHNADNGTTFVKDRQNHNTTHETLDATRFF